MNTKDKTPIIISGIIGATIGFLITAAMSGIASGTITPKTNVSVTGKSMYNTAPNITIPDAYSGSEFVDYNSFHYIIDDNLGIVYLLYNSENGVAITPMYNKDGTLVTKKQIELE